MAVLSDDYEKAKKLMTRIGDSGSISEPDYIEWPCFKEFRESKEFLEGFEEVFGYPPTSIEQIDNEVVDESKGSSGDGANESHEGVREEVKSDELDVIDEPA